MCSQESNLGWCRGIQHWVVQGHSGAKKVTVKVSVHIRHAAIIHELPCNGECIRITRFAAAPFRGESAEMESKLTHRDE